jgi:diadenosine tetraphosphate (Ap4A) HIT family hydrolase
MDDRFLKHLPIGGPARPFEGGIPGWEIFPFEGDLRVKPLEAPVRPEPPRNGEDGPESCSECQNPLRNLVWSDEHWRLRHLGGPTAVPMTLLLFPVAHHDSGDLPAERAAEMFPLAQRIERAITDLGGVGRVHWMKVGDGAAHLHLWFMARPAGLPQLRGSCLAIWDDVLPKQDEEQWRAALAQIGAALAAQSGTAH